MAEISTVRYARTCIGYGLFFFGVAYLLGSPAPSQVSVQVLIVPWAVVGAGIAFVMARRVWRTPMLYAEPLRLLVDMVDQGALDSSTFRVTDAQWEFAKLTWRYAFVTHKRDLLAGFLLVPLFFLSVIGGVCTFLGALIAFALGIHLGWYNPHRRHSALDYQSPINYERRQLSAALF